MVGIKHQVTYVLTSTLIHDGVWSPQQPHGELSVEDTVPGRACQCSGMVNPFTANSCTFLMQFPTKSNLKKRFR